ncbi:MAG: SDR family oxidoreductase [Promethearchaeota archaeon]
MTENVIMIDSSEFGLGNAIEKGKRILFGKTNSYNISVFNENKTALNCLENLVFENKEVCALIKYYDSTLTNYNGMNIIREVKRKYPKIRTILIYSNKQEEKKIFKNKEWIDDSFYINEHDYFKSIDSIFNQCFNNIKITDEIERQSLLGKNILITGVTGFIGGRFFRELLKNESLKLYLLGRSKRGRNFEDRVGINNERVIYIEGDLKNSKIVNKKKHLNLLKNNIEEIWHFAANTKVERKNRDEIMKTNLLGTINLIDFAKKIKKLKCFNYISTAYTSGDAHFPNEVNEQINNVITVFKNPYEESKFLTECILINSGLPYRIFKPSMVIGDSKTGECDIKTIYIAALLLYLVKLRFGKQQNCFKIPGDDKTRKNLIPIDCVVEMMLKIRDSGKGKNQCFALVNPKCTTVGTVLNTAAKLIGINLNYDPGLDKSSIKEIGDYFIYSQFEDFIPYMSISDPCFSMENTLSIIGNYEIPEPSEDFLNFSLNSFYTNVVPKLLKKERFKNLTAT